METCFIYIDVYTYANQLHLDIHDTIILVKVIITLVLDFILFEVIANSKSFKCHPFL